ncbi:hypothetical protein EDD21DRAFT_31454 [Dissophora ornata]|nr:U4/U6.U5 small nuclear ribonucleoprotein [Dissophora ornata]KAI8606253.1 hypothetical protein EDD21DRAFT_31454 [Dissophora ornata]
MPRSPSPDRHHDRRAGAPKDWDAPEEEEGEISYPSRRGGGGGGGPPGRDRERDRRDFRDRDRGDRDRDRGDRRRDDRYRESERDRRDYRDRGVGGGGGGGEARDSRRRKSSRSRSPYRRSGRSRSRSPRSRRGHRDGDADIEDGEYRKRRDDDLDNDDGARDHKKKDSSKQSGAAKDVDPEKPLEELSPEDEEARMMALMGFGGFDSTKGKHVAGADVSGADIKKQRQYRQYMNRRGGFNRPLDAK